MTDAIRHHKEKKIVAKQNNNKGVVGTRKEGVTKGKIWTKDQLKDEMSAKHWKKDGSVKGKQRWRC